MKFGSSARIIYNHDRGCPHMHHGYRAMLEYYTCNTSSVLVTNEEELRQAFLDETKYAITILNCHGWGKTDEDAVLNWEIRTSDGNAGCDDSELHWTKENISQYVKAGNGILLNTACWGAKKVWADPFLNAGFEWYVAAEMTSDMFSAYQFVSAFMGYLLYEERDYKSRVVTIPEAVEMACRIDDLPDGASNFRAFGKNI